MRLRAVPLWDGAEGEGLASRRSSREVVALSSQRLARSAVLPVVCVDELAVPSELPVILRGRWQRPDHTGFRNAAWAVRNARWAGQDENRMIAWLVLEFRGLVERGEPLESVVPSLVDLFMRP